MLIIGGQFLATAIDPPIPVSNFVSVCSGGSNYAPATAIFGHRATYHSNIAVAGAIYCPSLLCMTLSTPPTTRSQSHIIFLDINLSPSASLSPRRRHEHCGVLRRCHWQGRRPLPRTASWTQPSLSPVPFVAASKSSALPSNATSNYFLVTIARAFLRLRRHRRPHQTHRPPPPSSSPFPPSPYAPVTTPPVSLLMEMIVVLIYCTGTLATFR